MARNEMGAILKQRAVGFAIHNYKERRHHGQQYFKKNKNSELIAKQESLCLEVVIVAKIMTWCHFCNLFHEFCHKHFKKMQSVPKVFTWDNPDIDDGPVDSDDVKLFNIFMCSRNFYKFWKKKVIYECHHSSESNFCYIDCEKYSKPKWIKSLIVNFEPIFFFVFRFFIVFFYHCNF